MTVSRSAIVWLLLLLLAGACRPSTGSSWMGETTSLAPGVTLYRTNDSSLVEGAGPLAVFMLKIDPNSARIASVLSNDRVLDAEIVFDIARRHRAIAAINGGYFNRNNGEPTGVMKVAGELVSDASAARGAVVIQSPPGGPTSLVFDRLAAKVTMTVRIGDEKWDVPIDGVDTTRARGRLMLYTPAYHPHSDTAPTGTEWTLEGDPLRVTSFRPQTGQTPIPPGGAVLSYGGTTPTDELAAMEIGAEVTFATAWKSAFGLQTDVLDAATHIITGAGLLRRGGAAITDWKSEGLATEAFVDARHPRTLIGLDRDGAIWLIAADGRQPDYSIGMNFADLQRLCERLALTDALNLDGGGSTTMVARDQVVNRPSEPGGRPVSDAIIVTAR